MEKKSPVKVGDMIRYEVSKKFLLKNKPRWDICDDLGESGAFNFAEVIAIDLRAADYGLGFNIRYGKDPLDTWWFPYEAIGTKVFLANKPKPKLILRRENGKEFYSLQEEYK
jgi:hypothetical protein